MLVPMMVMGPLLPEIQAQSTIGKNLQDLRNEEERYQKMMHVEAMWELPALIVALLLYLVSRPSQASNIHCA